MQPKAKVSSDPNTKLKKPQTMMFNFRPIVAKRFRSYCKKKGLIMGIAVEKMIIAFLIEQKDIPDEDYISNQEQMEK